MMLVFLLELLLCVNMRLRLFQFKNIYRGDTEHPYRVTTLSRTVIILGI